MLFGGASDVAFLYLKSLFDGLVRYYHEAPAETARFSRDPQLMAHVTQVMGEREAVVCALIAALDAIWTSERSTSWPQD